MYTGALPVWFILKRRRICPWTKVLNETQDKEKRNILDVHRGIIFPSYGSCNCVTEREVGKEGGKSPEFLKYSSDQRLLLN